MKKTIAFLIAVIILMPTIALAAEFRAPSNNDTSVTIGKNETAKNLYTAGSLLNIDGSMKSDLVAAGGTINLNGETESDLLAAGGTLNIKGNVGKNARIAGGSVYMNGNVGEDLLAAGNMVSIDKNSVISGDFIGLGSAINIDGKIQGKAYLSGEDIKINGEINGDVTIKNVSNLTIGDSTKISGKLFYSSPNEAKISGGAQISGGIDYKKISTGRYKWETTKAAGVLYGILISFITLLALVLIFPRLARLAVQESSKNYLTKMGWGLFGLVAMPILIIALMVSVIGMKLAFILALLYTLFVLLASILSPLIAGSYIVKAYDKKKEFRADWVSVLVGVISLTILGLVPVISWIIVFLLFLLSLGLLGTAIWKYVSLAQR